MAALSYKIQCFYCRYYFQKNIYILHNCCLLRLDEIKFIYLRLCTVRTFTLINIKRDCPYMRKKERMCINIYVKKYCKKRREYVINCNKK